MSNKKVCSHWYVNYRKELTLFLKISITFFKTNLMKPFKLSMITELYFRTVVLSTSFIHMFVKFDV